MTQKPPMQQTTQQERARSAWNAVSKIERSQSWAKEYGSLIKGLPMEIQRDGLGPTLAFLAAKGKDQHREALNQMAAWVLPKLGAAQHRDGLLGYVLECSSDDYRRATSETLAYLAWLKRFVEAKDLGEAS